MQCPVLAARKASSDWLHGMSLAMSVAASLLFIYMPIFRAWVPRKSYELSSSFFWLPRPKLWRCLWVFFVTLCPIHQEILKVASLLHQYPLAWATIIPHRFLQQPLNWPSCFRLCSHTVLSPCSSWWSFKILSQTLLLLWSKPSHISDLTQNKCQNTYWGLHDWPLACYLSSLICLLFLTCSALATQASLLYFKLLSTLLIPDLSLAIPSAWSTLPQDANVTCCLTQSGLYLNVILSDRPPWPPYLR